MPNYDTNSLGAAAAAATGGGVGSASGGGDGRTGDWVILARIVSADLFPLSGQRHCGDTAAVAPGIAPPTVIVRRAAAAAAAAAPMVGRGWRCAGTGSDPAGAARRNIHPFVFLFDAIGIE